MTKLSTKDFALQQIAPYYKDPTTCGILDGDCCYLTEDGKMCVAGKNFTKKAREGYKNANTCIAHILKEKGEEVLTPKSRGILNSKQWENMQQIHDKIAKGDMSSAKYFIKHLDLFTFEELKEYSKKL